jgi:ATP-dependent Clp protease ATP-binding subunit ClpA
MFERFSDGARGVVIRAQGQARSLKHPYIGTEHLLLALLDPAAGAAATVLRDAGVMGPRVRQEVERLVGIGRPPLTAEDAAALSAIGIDLPAVLARIEDALGPGALTVAKPATRRRRLLRRRRPRATHAVPLTARAKKVLELSVREALALHHDRVAPEHLLLGLLREGRGLACRLLTDAGADLNHLRRATLTALDTRC